MPGSNPNRFAALAAALFALVLTSCSSDPIVEAARPTKEDRAEAPARAPVGTIPALMRTGEALRQAGDLNNALAHFRRAHQIDLFDPAPLVKIGVTLNELGHYNEAAQVFEDALALEHNNTAALRGLASALIARNQPSLAIDNLKAALAIEPDHRTYNALGVAYDHLGDHAAAQNYYDEGLGLFPNNLLLLNNLGLSQLLSGDTDAAISNLTRAAQSSGAGPQQRQNLALAYGLAGRDQEAARILRLDLDNRAIQSNLAYYGILRAADDAALMAAVMGVHVPANTPAPPAAQESGLAPQDVEIQSLPDEQTQPGVLPARGPDESRAAPIAPRSSVIELKTRPVGGAYDTNTVRDYSGGPESESQDIAGSETGEAMSQPAEPEARQQAAIEATPAPEPQPEPEPEMTATAIPKPEPHAAETVAAEPVSEAADEPETAPQVAAAEAEVPDEPAAPAAAIEPVADVSAAVAAATEVLEEAAESETATAATAEPSEPAAESAPARSAIPAHLAAVEPDDDAEQAGIAAADVSEDIDAVAAPSEGAESGSDAAAALPLAESVGSGSDFADSGADVVMDEMVMGALEETDSSLPGVSDESALTEDIAPAAKTDAPGMDGAAEPVDYRFDRDGADDAAEPQTDAEGPASDDMARIAPQAGGAPPPVTTGYSDPMSEGTRAAATPVLPPDAVSGAPVWYAAPDSPAPGARGSRFVDSIADFLFGAARPKAPGRGASPAGELAAIAPAAGPAPGAEAPGSEFKSRQDLTSRYLQRLDSVRAADPPPDTGLGQAAAP